MSLVSRAVARWADEIADASAAIGRKVVVERRAVLDRSGDIVLGRPGLWSPNRACRLVRALDGWLAVNLPRGDDRDMVPAWLGREVPGNSWRAIVATVRERRCGDLLAQARLLGLPVSIVGEVAAVSPVGEYRLGNPGTASKPPRVIDLTSMWAGPLCGALLAEAGAAVTRIESIGRQDPTRVIAPALHGRLNRGKTGLTLDFADPVDRARLADAIAAADIVLTSARPRAFDALGITPAVMAARNPGLIWVAVTGHGWTGEGADRVAFGDDAAAAGGLMRWTVNGAPRFAGDALADPLTGLAAAAAAMRARARGGGVLLDVAMARVAADAASGR